MTNKREIWKYTEFSLGMVHISSTMVEAGESWVAYIESSGTLGYMIFGFKNKNKSVFWG